MTAPALVELKCTNCGSQLDPQNISPQLAAARCPHCNSLFAIPTHTSAPPQPPEQPKIRPKARQPKNINVSTQRGDLILERRWFSPAILFFLFFALFWTGFSVFWVIGASAVGGFFGLFGLPFVAIGIGMLYAVAAGIMNSTTIQVGASALSVKHGPLPWAGNKSIPRHQIAQIFCREVTRQTKNGSNTTYTVEVVSTDNHREPLIKSLNQEDEALYIEQQLETFLGIKDSPVRGEMER
ncbi:hypothetical protein [Sulfuriroseicoccus oceanibius]|uniref:Uncharacterized protein n=1 Tax=Sulfuriroseicoccus oceanibius TaxID=2707525 RepID=A0A6B3L231_9BACT|nr:hypothetical protein [Sulfuriroseicoccus oceanibius]QQL44216.1 hypothetical protein G3M56_009950 [Sulfuriroseicoccus oceanibius]